MAGKTGIITGATDGIGLATAVALAPQVERLFLVGRNREKGAAAVEKVRAAGASEVEFLRADLSVQRQIRDLVDKIAEQGHAIDLLFNNAGALYQKRLLSSDGIEMTFALNHLGYFLLTNLLLPQMSEEGRVVVVASRAHEGAKLDFDDLEGQRSYGGWRAYQRSKLANLYFTYELAQRLKDSGSRITVNAMHPGFVASNFGEETTHGLFGKALRFAKGVAATTPEKAAQSAVHLSVSDAVDGKTGQYYVGGRPKASSSVSRKRDPARRLWEISERMTGLAR